MNDYKIYTVCIISVIFYLICMLSKYSSYYNKETSSKAYILVKQALKWSENTEKNTLSAYKKSIYASAYLASARLLQNDSELSKLTGVDIQELWKRISDKESYCSKKIGKDLKLKKSALPTSNSWV